MTYCAAYGCNNSKKKDNCRNKTFFQFPLKNPNLLKTWIAKIRREKFVPSYASVLCSDHFEEDCFEYQNFTNRRHLKPGSVPTNFVFTKSPSSRRILERCKPSTSTEIYTKASGDGLRNKEHGQVTRMTPDLLTSTPPQH
ncbi:THAP domain-containing protein 3 [Trichonephila clavipes]|nr:THAP domain-containing protein 3 [Trichonephila clavipes]